jgi:alkaline phosphatase
MLNVKKYFLFVSTIFLVLTLVIGIANVDAVTAKPPAPKYVIVMIGDGMGYEHVTASSYYQYGADLGQIYNRFPTRNAVATYGTEACDPKGYDSVKAWTIFDYVKACPVDSAAAATALATGVATYNAGIGVGPDKNPVMNVIEAAEMLGKSTGVVTSVPVSHATPAGFVAHNIHRNNYVEIANEMFDLSAVDVIMGGGHPWYFANGMKRDTVYYRYIGENAWEGLVHAEARSDADGDGMPDAWTLIESRDDFQNLMHGDTPSRVAGIAKVYDTLQQGRDGDKMAAPFVVPFTETIPTLKEMTMGAINVLDNNPNGFFLMVEGGAVDWAAHSNQSGRMIEEMMDFDQTVEAVVDWVQANSNWGETLLIVTGDHETGYLTGPGSNPTWEPIVNNGPNNLPGMQWNSGDHTNSLLGLYAKGDDARLFSRYATLRDPVRGRYMHNTAVAKVIFQVYGFSGN